MDKKRSIWVWGLLIALLCIMIFIEISSDDDKTQKSKDDEVIYLSYQQDPIVAEVTPEHSIFESVQTHAEPEILSQPAVGRLAVSSVIINKKYSPQAAKSDQIENTVFAAMQQQDLTYKIFQGQRFSAVLTHAIQSDLPGMVVAEVSQDIYGYQSNHALLPTGTRLIGQYNNRLNIGDSRLYILWQRAITPDGIDIELGSTATDRLGQAGLTGVVDNHFWEIFGTSSLLSVMAVGASNLSGEQGELSNQYQQSVTDALTDTSNVILNDRLSLKPTIHIPQGTIVHVVAAKDLDFSTVLKRVNQIPIF